MTLKNLFAIALIAVLFSGCNISVTGIPGSGISKTETRDVSGFEKISMGGAGNVKITIADKDSLTITADDNLLEIIESNVEDGVLTISPKESISPKTDLVFNITIAKLSHVSVGGAANITIDNANGDSLEVVINGAGKVAGNGSVKSLEVKINGAGSVELEQLKSESTAITLSGAGSGEVFASQSINATINGVGSITVHGNPPKVKKQVNGIGKVEIAK